MRDRVPFSGWRLPTVELLFVIPIAIGVVYTFIFLYLNGYLPVPYFYEPSGTFMDYAAPATFAHRGGAYDAFQTIYPPLSYVLLKFMSWGPCYQFNASEEARACDLYGIGWLVIFYVINSVLIVKSFVKIDRKTAFPRSFAIIAGLSMTYAFERGNVILMCFTCMILAYGPLLRSARLRWVFAGLVINFKVYLIGTIFAHLLRRRWRWFEGAMLATIIIYIITYALLGEGTPKEIYRNITAYAGGYRGSTLLDSWYPSSFVPLRGLLAGDTELPVITAIGSKAMVVANIVIRTIMITVQISVIAAAAATWFRPQGIPMHRLVALTMGLAITSSEVGGYTHMMLIFFVFMEPWKGFGRRFAIILSYLLSIALDFPIERIPPIVRDSYLGNRLVIAELYVGIGAFVRPLMIYLLLFSLAMVTIRQVWLQLLCEGWRLRLPRGPRPIMADPVPDITSKATPT